MKFIIGEKIEMSQRYNEFGEVIPVTRILVKPCLISQIRTPDKDGYAAVQLAAFEKKRLNKPEEGHLKGLKKLGYLREFRVQDASPYKKGDEVKPDIFEAGELVGVTGLSKGHGFQGVVKRYGFKGAPATHGNKDQLRMTGSIGSTGPAHVFKGKRMPGRMGHQKATVSNLEVIEVDKKKNEIVIKGAVPGPRKNPVLIFGLGKKAKKRVLEEEKEIKEEKEKKKSAPKEKEAAGANK